MKRASKLYTCLSCVIFVSFLVLLTIAQSACPEEATTLLVASTDDALELTEALNCSGPGQFEVEWSGEVMLNATIDVPEGISLKVTGSSSSSSPILGLFDEAVIDGGSDLLATPSVLGIQLFTVDENAILELDSVSLVRGWGYGAAVSLGEGSRLVARNCSFTGHRSAGKCVWIMPY